MVCPFTCPYPRRPNSYWDGAVFSGMAIGWLEYPLRLLVAVDIAGMVFNTLRNSAFRPLSFGWRTVAQLGALQSVMRRQLLAPFTEHCQSPALAKNRDDPGGC